MDTPTAPIPKDKTREPAEPPPVKPPRHPDPTRYGDWELSGKCVDF